jgi:signal transduction histidine kinase
MRRRRLPLGLIVPCALVLLVASLATLQYRWLGQVSEAERARLQTSLTQRADEFAEDFDRELMRVYLGFQTDGGALPGSDPASFAGHYDAWHATAKYPQIVRAVYRADGGDAGASLLQYHPDTKVFEPVAWPDALAPVRARLAKSNAAVTLGDKPPVWTAHEPILASVPALVITLPTFQSFSASDPKNFFTMRLSQAVLVVELDREYLRSSLLPALAARYFPEREADLYRFAVIDAADAAHPIYSRGLATGATLRADRADASVPLFSLRFDLATQVVVRQPGAGDAIAGLVTTMRARTSAPTSTPPAPVAAPVAGTGRSAAVSVFVQSRGTGVQARGTTENDVLRIDARPAARAAWQLVLQHSAGSLDAAVGQARRRNLWLSFGILAVLAAGVSLVVVNAERSQRLAAQQMDFVATVSHELRTPLTVIRSAAQNLSAGVVHDAEQARRYGDLIESEGRRLTDMVEQVLEYAGLGGNRQLARTHPVDAGAVIAEVVASSASLFEAERFEVRVDVAEGLPPVLADEGAIRRALHNLLTNAVKYGADGRWIGISARRSGARGGGRDEVQIAVSDRGRGVDADDLAHLFEPFYRGRYALDRQIHGNGLGLSLVKRIAEAHGGRATAASTPGEGATFTLHLPAAAPDPAAVAPLADPSPQT